MTKIASKIAWSRVLFLIGTPVAAIPLTYYYVSSQPFNLGIWLLFLFFYVFSIFGITGGYHRLFAHRAYQANTALKWFYALFGAAAIQNSILVWGRDHRVHHRFVDTDKDPYNINRGFWYAHIGWMLQIEESPVDLESYGRDFENDPIVMFQHKYYLPIALAMCFVVPTILGWMVGSALGGLLIVGLLRLVCVHHVTFFINSWCHMWGKQTYSDKQTARDSFLMAIATMGEGYHNYHHIFANDYRNGVKWYQWDPTKWFIRFCAWLGLASHLHRIPQHKIVKMQLEMDEKRAKSSWSREWQTSFQEQLDSIKMKVDAAYAKMDQLRNEYRALKAHYSQAHQARLNEIRAQIRIAKTEAKAARRQWQNYIAWLSKASQQNFNLST